MGEQSTITGGTQNMICADCTSGTIVGGIQNEIKGKKSKEGTIGGGSSNVINNSESGTIVGGQQNKIKNSDAGTIGGGQNNQVTGDFATVGGGQDNIASGEGSVIPGGRQNKASGAFAIAFGRRAEAKDERSLVINLQEGGGKLQSDGKSTFSAAANRFIFQIGQDKAIIDETSIVELDNVLNGDGRRNLRSTHTMTPTRIRELIQEQKIRHEEQQDTVSKLQQELTALVEDEKQYRERGLELEDTLEVNSVRSLKKKQITGAFAVEEQGLDNTAAGTGSVVNGGQDNLAAGTLSVVGGGLQNDALDSVCVIGGGENNKAEGLGSVVGGGKQCATKGEAAFVGGGSKNRAFSPFSAIGGGSGNVLNSNAPYGFIGGGFKNKCKSEWGFIGGGLKNQVQAKWASVLGGEKNIAKGNYATAMGRNALANKNLCMAIGLQLESNKKVRANRVGDWIVRAQTIKIQINEQAVILTPDNIKNFKKILKGSRRRRAEARSDDERNLLTELEELEDLVDIQEVEIEDLEGDIQDFHRELEEANEDELLEIDSM